MIKISPEAQHSLRQFLDRSHMPPNLRLVIAGDIPGAYHPSFLPMGMEEPSPQDTLVQCDLINVYLDPRSADKAEGLSVSILHTGAGPRLKFDFPSPSWEDPLANRLQQLIDQRINPALQNHGGFVALLGVHNGVAEVHMGGGCQGCALSAQTLSDSIVAIIQQEMPEIRRVVDCTDHARGEQPFYRSAPDPGQSRSARRRSRRKHN